MLIIVARPWRKVLGLPDAASRQPIQPQKHFAHLRRAKDAAIMYARACRAWYGRRAPRVVQAKIAQLRRNGDHEGVEAWSEVARQLSRMND
jgi:hypothetical protein